MAIGRLVIPLYTQMLEALLAQLHKASAHLGHDDRYEALGERRLIDDMFPLRDQIRFVCLQASEAVARLAGRPVTEVPQPVSLADAEKLIGDTLALVQRMDPAELDAAATTPIRLELASGDKFRLSGEDYVRDWAIPQFHFHLVTAYAILRASGVPLGKIDYAGHMFRHRERLNPDALPSPARRA